MINILPYSQWNKKMLARRFPIKYLNSIPVIQTISVLTIDNVVVYKLCPWRIKLLNNEGLMLLSILLTPTSTEYPVSLEIESLIPLVNSLGVLVNASSVTNGSYLLVYFNKCKKIFLVINYIPTTT